MVTPDEITLSITTLNRPVELAATLRRADRGPAIQVIINSGDPGQYDNLAKESPHIRFIVNARNLGVTGSWNQGIVLSNTRYVVPSGDDLIYDANWAEVLIDRLNQAPTSTPVSLSEPTRYSAFCIDKATIPKLGWFDHNYARVYYEDEDWFLRTQEFLGTYNVKDAFTQIPERLNVVHRRPHTTAPWNSIPNRVYFWKKWERIPEETEDSFYVRPDIIVRRRLTEPSWPSLEKVAGRYRGGDFSEAEFRFDKPAYTTRLLTTTTTNRLVIGLRKRIQARTNPDGVLR